MLLSGSPYRRCGVYLPLHIVLNVARRSMKARHTATEFNGRPLVETRPEAIERIYHDWDAALSKNDPEALLALYAPDATLESPLIPHLMQKEHGICKGHGELRELFNILA